MRYLVNIAGAWRLYTHVIPATSADHRTMTSTQTTAAGLQILAPWAASQMDTTSRLRAPQTAQERPMPLFTQDADAEARAVAASQRSLFDGTE